MPLWENWLYVKSCKNSLCSYQHTPEIIVNDDDTEDESDDILIDEKVDKSNCDSTEFKCDNCGKTHKNENDLVDHLIETSHNLTEEDKKILFG